MTLTFDLPNENFKKHFHSLRRCQIISKSIQNCKGYGPDKNLTFKRNFDLNVRPTWKNVSDGTSTSDGEQLCQIILKSIYNCGIYSPDKFGRTYTCTYTKLSLWQLYLLNHKRARQNLSKLMRWIILKSVTLYKIKAVTGPILRHLQQAN